MRLGRWWFFVAVVATAAALVVPSQRRPAVAGRRFAAPPPPPSRDDDDVAVVADDDQLKRDIERFKQTQAPREVAEAGPLQTVVNGLGVILSVNFVVIVGLFLYFLWGVFSLYALSNDAAISVVKASFDPIILPILSTHMGLTFLSAGLERVISGGDEAD